MKVTGSRTKHQEKVFINIIMVQNMKVNGLMIISMEQVFKHG